MVSHLGGGEGLGLEEWENPHNALQLICRRKHNENSWTESCDGPTKMLTSRATTLQLLSTIFLTHLMLAAPTFSGFITICDQIRTCEVS